MFKLLTWPIFSLSIKITWPTVQAWRGLIKLGHLRDSMCWDPGGGGTVVHAGGGCQSLLAVVRFTPLPSCVICMGGGR